MLLRGGGLADSACKTDGEGAGCDGLATASQTRYTEGCLKLTEGDKGGGFDSV